jgi:hypothetical protein
MLLSKIKNWVNNEVSKELDKEPFSSLPLKMRIGIFIILGSFLIGHGSNLFLVVIPGVNKQLSVSNIIGGSSIYAICWVTGNIGIFLAGKDSIKYPIYFFAKLLKFLFRSYFEN